jgi:hypothetical protein
VYRILLIAFMLAATPALAQTPPYDYPITLSTAQVKVLGPNPTRKRLVFVNPNATATVAVCPAVSRVNSAAITCAVNGAGSITILPYASFTVDGVGQNGGLPSPWNAISDTPGSALSIMEFE